MLQKTQVFFHISMMLSDRNAFTTREEAVPGRGEQLKVGEQDGMVWGVILADVSSFTEIWVDKWQLVGKRV